MKNPVSRVLLMLAASEGRLSELHYFFRWVQDVGPSRATGLVDDLRRDLRRFDDLPVSSRSLLNPYGATGSDKSTAQRLEQLLLEEGGLTKNDAAALLSKELMSEHRSAGPLPRYNKVSFSSWLKRLVDRFGENKMLQAASRIRNRVTRTEDSHWPLKRE